LYLVSTQLSRTNIFNSFEDTSFVHFWYGAAVIFCRNFFHQFIPKYAKLFFSIQRFSHLPGGKNPFPFAVEIFSAKKQIYQKKTRLCFKQNCQKRQNCTVFFLLSAVEN
jgi:hypothetical protein